MYKTNFVKDKKLVKTTTFLAALLVAATLIFSSAVSAISINGTAQNFVGKIIENNVSSSRSRDGVVNPELSLADELEFPTNPSPTGVSLLTEGFEGSWPGDWTLIQTNPGPGGGSIPPYWSQTDYDQHSGTYAAGLWWDYAHQDEWLISPDIELTGAAPGDEYYVTFWTYGWEGSVYDDHYYVKVSTDNGTTWTPLFDLSDLTGGDWNAWAYPYTIDLTAYADETVKLAWHAIDCNDPGNPNYPGLWYIWIIDDIEVGYTTAPDHDVGVTGIISPVSGPAGVITPEVTVENFGLEDETDVPIHMTISKIAGVVTTTLVEEYFEGTFPPTGWTVINNAVACPWVRNDFWATARPNYAGGDGFCADADADKCGSGTTWPMDTELISPSFSLAGYLNAHATFMAAYNYLSGDYADVDISIDGGSSWTNLLHWNSDHSAYGPGESVDINLGAYLGETNVMIRWHYYADSWDYYYEIDDVYIYGETFNLIGEYDNTEYVDVDSGATVDYTFILDWTPDDWQVSENVDIDYVVSACTELPTDEDNSNNCSSDVATLSYPYLHDIELVSINSPTIGRGPAQTQDVEVTIKNVGQFPECCYKTNVQIGGWIPTGPPTTITYDFESNDGGFLPTATWDPVGDWAWTDSYDYSLYTGAYTPPPNAYSGDGLWATVPHGDYTNAGGSSFLSKTIDLTGVTDAEISFYEWHDVFGSFDWIAVNVNGVQEWFHDSSTPSTSWQLVTIDLDDYAGQSSVEIVFELYATTVVERAGWYIDDVTILDVETVFTLEYDEDICTILLDPGEEAVLEFPDWTPDGLSNYGFSGTIAYDVTATALATGDTNPANDQATAAITLDYFHDVGVKDITQPSMGGSRDEDWIYYDDGVYYNAIGLTSGGTFYGGIRFTPTELAGYDGWSLSKAQFYWHDDGVGPDTGVVHIYDEGTPSSPGPELSSEPYTVNTDGWKVVDLSSPVTIDASKEIWVVFEITHVAGGHPLSVDNGPQVAGKSQWISLDGTSWDELVDLNAAWTWNWMMRAFVIETEGPPPVEVYVASGTSPPIEAIVENLGTFTETDLTCYAELYEYITDPLNGTLVYEDNETGISLNPLGDTQTVDFDSYNFVDQGVYGLEIDFPLGIDGYTDNNHKRLGIGCDGTEPTSTHTLDPLYPDGLNDWYVSDVEVTLDAEDGTEDWQSGVKEIKYRINGGTIQTISGDHGSFMLTDDGDDIEVEYWAIDNVDNEESPHNTFTVDIDQTEPEIDAAWEAYQEGLRWYVRFTITATDATSGMERVEMWINLGIHETVTGTGPTYEFVIQWSSVFKTVTFKFVAYDLAGHSDYDEILGGNITAYPYPSVKSQSSSQHTHTSPVTIKQTALNPR